MIHQPSLFTYLRCWNPNQGPALCRAVSFRDHSARVFAGVQGYAEDGGGPGEIGAGLEEPPQRRQEQGRAQEVEGAAETTDPLQGLLRCGSVGRGALQPMPQLLLKVGRGTTVALV